jgi:hypothetical protein
MKLKHSIQFSKKIVRYLFIGMIVIIGLFSIIATGGGGGGSSGSISGSGK